MEFSSPFAPVRLDGLTSISTPMPSQMRHDVGDGGFRDQTEIPRPRHRIHALGLVRGSGTGAG